MADPVEHTNAFKVFHYHFYFRVPKMFTITQEELDGRGFITSGNPLRDKEMAKEPVDVRGTIRQMVNYRRDGATITLNYPVKDSVRIYEYITGYLDEVTEALYRSFNTRPPDQELLRDLDELAADVYKVARHYIQTNARENTGLGIFERQRSFGLGGKKSRIKVNVEKEHKSMSESISMTALERNKPWQ